MQHSFDLIRPSVVTLVFIALFSTPFTWPRADSAAMVIDWSKSAVQDTDSSCRDFTFKNMKDDSTYSFFVRGTGGGVCNFHADGLTFHYPSNFGPVSNGTRTFFAFARFGSDVLVTWTTGY